LVEKVFQKRSKSSIFAVTRIKYLLLCRECHATWPAEYRSARLALIQPVARSTMPGGAGRRGPCLLRFTVRAFDVELARQGQAAQFAGGRSK
jgi:hypothetical protein